MGISTLEVDGQSTRVLDRGDGRPVVVLHGWGGRIESMTPVIECLAAGFRVVAVDLPGFGESPLPPSTWGTPDYAGFLARLIARLDLGSPSIMGHSFGAKAALYLAATRPPLVDKLVLVGSSGLRMPPSFKARMKRSLSRTARAVGRFGPPGRALREAVYRRVASADYRDAGGLRPILVKVVNEDLKELLPQVRASTLLVWGENDDAVPLAHARAFERAIPDAGLVVFEGAGHFCYLDQPDRFCRIVRHFLGDTAGR